MKQKLLGKVSLLLVCVLLVLSLASCAGLKKPYPSKNELQFWVEVLSTDGYTTVAEHLEAWHFPTFSAAKLAACEDLFKKVYYRELPDAHTLAQRVADIYLEKFYDETDKTSEVENTTALINSYIAAVGDKYAVYRSETEYKDYSSDMSGNYVGIGVSVRHDAVEDIIRITEVVPDGPADAAGVLPNDIIYSVDGVTAKSLGYSATVAAVRGEAGSTFVLGVLREGTLVEFTITRRAMTDQTVRYSLDEQSGIAYVRITQFKGNTAQQFRDAIDKLEANSLTKGYIFDVRGNPGGYLYSVVEIISYLTPKDSMVVCFTPSYSDPMYDTDDHQLDKPMVILTSEYTASAGELFASSVREIKDCQIIGKTTYGKGVMQNTYLFTDKASLTLTICEYNPPSGKNYDGIGVIPDYVVENTEDTDNQLLVANEKLLEKIQKETNK